MTKIKATGNQKFSKGSNDLTKIYFRPLFKTLYHKTRRLTNQNCTMSRQISPPLGILTEKGKFVSASGSKRQTICHSVTVCVSRLHESLCSEAVMVLVFTWERLKEATVLSSYSRMLMVSKAHVLSASRPDFRDIITRQASGVPGIKTVGFLTIEGEKKGDHTLSKR